MALPLGFFLDSGAFSAFTQKTAINIDEYIAFIKKYEKFIEVYANLDAIGTGEQSAKKTLENQKYMESKGLKPLPCFHVGEPLSYLEYYVKNYDYIALGGMAAGLNNKQRQLFLDECFSKYICDADGLPKVRTHGFGMTSFNLMFRYPWYSVDSTSWSMASRMGQIYILLTRNGEFDWSKPPFKLAVSALSPNVKEKGTHYNNITPTLKKQVDKYLADLGFVMGKTEYREEPADYVLKEGERFLTKKSIVPRKVEKVIIPGLENDYIMRDQVNILYYKQLEKCFKPYPWAFKPKNTMKGLLS